MSRNVSRSNGQQIRVQQQHRLPVLHQGQRVRLRPPLIEVELRSPLGTIARDGDYSGYYVVRLDEPARYYPLGRATSPESEEINELVESADNLDIWEGGRWREPNWVAEKEDAEGLTSH